MIRRDRTSVREPASLAALRKQALADLRAFYAIDRGERSQQRPDLDRRALADPGVRAALVELFEGKCAYCESPLDPGYFEVDQFRPQMEAMDLDGQIPDPDLYWWLAFDWANLYPSCVPCSRAKANRFPVRGPRARPEERGEALDAERPLILDPCRDDPPASIRFQRTGDAVALDEVGAVSIEVFALNRPELVTMRRDAAEHLLRQLVTLSAAQAAAAADMLAPPSAPFAVLLRQLILEHVGRLGAAGAGVAATRRAARPAAGVGMAAIGRAARPAAGEKMAAVPRAAQGSVSLDRIDIENFRSIRALTLEFPRAGSEADSEPWLMLLGVNGVGKSSVLQAVALALMTPAARRRYIPDASELVTRDAPEAEGVVRLSFSDGSRVALRFRRDQPGFERTGRLPVLNVYGFGSTRLPPPPGERRRLRPAAMRFDNLFDPRYPLSLAEAWMADETQVSSSTFDFLAASLRPLLELDDEETLGRRDGALQILRDGTALPLADYSDGYRSIVVFATDLMRNLSERWDSIASAEGLVLVDELEVHLHPSWRMTVVDRLREVFPRLRFLITTHDPLCLRGSRRGEVHILYRDDDTREVLVRQRDIPPGLTADQLLTGTWFGMPTTVDTETTRLMTEHAGLLLQRQTPTVVERRTAIEAELRQRRGSFAETEDEALVRTVVAELRAEQPALSGEQKEAAREAILRRAHARQGDAGGQR
jgi:uncharacterized protein (TIGR02646 family)